MPPDPQSPTRADLARELLRYKMEEYSQEGFCASWMIDLEYELWTAVDRPDPDERDSEMVKVSRECRMLADIAGGWWAWDPDDPATANPTFFPLDRWQELLARHKPSDIP